MAKSASRTIERYLERLAYPIDPRDTLPPPAPNLKLCIVIPALAELETLPNVLHSLTQNSQRLPEAEVIVVLNAPENAPPEILENNRQTLARLKDLTPTPLPIHILDRTSPGRAFPPDKSGVGHARRHGMDLALRRLHATQNAARHGIIACLDADSPTAPAYIDHLLDAFTDPKHLAGLCRYRHPIPHDENHARAIIAYELWLRFSELSLRHARSPYAFQTIGSCTIITARGYAMADGMSRKQAGEDFYMLEKLIKVGGPQSITRLDHILVEPAARPSQRVPFGTGVAITELTKELTQTNPNAQNARQRYQHVPPPHIYTELARFFTDLPRAHTNPDALERNIAPTVFAFLDTINGRATIEKLRTNHASTEQFTRAFHTWFDALRTKQFAQFAREFHGEQPIFTALAQLLGPAVADLPPNPTTRPHQLAWLERIRQLS